MTDAILNAYAVGIKSILGDLHERNQSTIDDMLRGFTDTGGSIEVTITPRYISMEQTGRKEMRCWPWRRSK